MQSVSRKRLFNSTSDLEGRPKTPSSPKILVHHPTPISEHAAKATYTVLLSPVAKRLQAHDGCSGPVHSCMWADLCLLGYFVKA